MWTAALIMKLEGEETRSVGPRGQNTIAALFLASHHRRQDGTVKVRVKVKKK
jgi:hypothetical protein